VVVKYSKMFIVLGLVALCLAAAAAWVSREQLRDIYISRKKPKVNWTRRQWADWMAACGNRGYSLKEMGFVHDESCECTQCA
jgi:hypothetical protein